MNELYDSTLVTIGAVGVSILTKKVINEQLGVPTTLMGTLKLAAAVGLSTVGLKYAQKKKWIPNDPFDKKINK